MLIVCVAGGTVEGAIVKNLSSNIKSSNRLPEESAFLDLPEMDHHSFSQNRNIPGGGAGAGQSQHPLASVNGSIYGNDHVHPLESLAAMEQLIAQQTARQMAENHRGGFDQLNINGGIDFSGLCGQSALAQLQAQANHEAVASELAMRIAKQSRADETLAMSDPLHQRQHLLQQHLLSLQQQQQLEALRRANPQMNQNIMFQDNVDHRNRDFLHLQKDVQLLDLLRVREDLILQRQKQAEGLKAAAAAAAASQQAQQAQHQSNLLASYGELDRLQLLRHLNFSHNNSGHNTALGNGSHNGLPFATAAALGIFGQRELNDLNMLHHYQHQQNQKNLVSSMLNNNRNTRAAKGIPILPKSSNEDITDYSTGTKKIMTVSQPSPKLPQKKKIPNSPKAIDLSSNVVNEKVLVTNKLSEQKTISRHTTETKSLSNRNPSSDGQSDNQELFDRVKSMKKSQSPQDMSKAQDHRTSDIRLKNMIDKKVDDNSAKQKNSVDSENNNDTLNVSEVSHEQQLRFFNNGVETLMDGSPIDTKVLLKTNSKKPQTMTNHTHQITKTITKDSFTSNPKMKSSDHIPSIPQTSLHASRMNGNNLADLKPSKNSSLVPKVAHIKTNGISPKILPITTNQNGKRYNDNSAVLQRVQVGKKIKKTFVEPNKLDQRTNDIGDFSKTINMHNSKIVKTLRGSSGSGKRLLPTLAQSESSNETQQKIFTTPAKTIPSTNIPKIMSQNIKSGANPQYLIPQVKKEKKSNAIVHENLKKKKKNYKSNHQDIKKATMPSALSMAKVQGNNHSVARKATLINKDESKSLGLSIDCTRAEFFTFVIDRVPELASSVVIIQDRCQGESGIDVPIQAVNLILAELYYLANVDVMHDVARKQTGNALPIFREMAKERINSCIIEIEKYKNTMMSSKDNNNKKVNIKTKNSTYSPPMNTCSSSSVVASVTKSHESDVKSKSLINQPRKNLKLKKPWKPSTELQDFQDPKTQKWSHSSHGNIEVTTKQSRPSLKKAHDDNTRAIKAAEGPRSDMIEVLTKEGNAKKNSKDPKIEQGALNAARMLLNFGAK